MASEAPGRVGGGSPDGEPANGIVNGAPHPNGTHSDGADTSQHGPSLGQSVELDHRCAPSYMAAFLDIALIIPTIAAVATVFAYVGGPTWLGDWLRFLALGTGAVAAVAIGLSLIALYRPMFTAADRAQPESYGEVRQRADGLAARLERLHANPVVAGTSTISEATSHWQALERDLARSGPQWAIGSGYLNALTRLHRAEEALISVQPVDDLLADALFDEMRLSGARLTDVDHLRGKLRAAVKALSSTAAATYLIEPIRGDRVADAASSTDTSQNGSTHMSEAGLEPLTTSEARVALRQVRRAINDFRDESRARLIRARTRLLATMTLTGFITYVLLAFAVNVRESSRAAGGLGPGDPIVAAAAIYLVGAVVGLFNRLYVESGDDAAGEDYGLSRARLLLTPMLSGVAAVGGVLITGMLSGALDVTAVAPSPILPPTPTVSGAAASATATPGAVLPQPSGGPSTSGGPSGIANALPAAETSASPVAARPPASGGDASDRRGMVVPRVRLTVGDIFSLQDYPFALVLAALFGLTPRAFLERLQRSSDQSRLDLKSTDAHQPTPIPPGAQTQSGRA